MERIGLKMVYILLCSILMCTVIEGHQHPNIPNNAQGPNRGPNTPPNQWWTTQNTVNENNPQAPINTFLGPPSTANNNGYLGPPGMGQNVQPYPYYVGPPAVSPSPLYPPPVNSQFPNFTMVG